MRDTPMHLPTPTHVPCRQLLSHDSRTRTLNACGWDSSQGCVLQERLYTGHSPQLWFSATYREHATADKFSRGRGHMVKMCGPVDGPIKPSPTALPEP